MEILIFIVLALAIFAVLWKKFSKPRINEMRKAEKQVSWSPTSETRYTPVTKSNYRRTNKISDMDNTTFLAAAVMMSSDSDSSSSSSSSSGYD